MSHLTAGIDESKRPNAYLLCATVVSPAARRNMQLALRGLLLPNQRRLHANNENAGRKRTLLKSMTQIPGISCHLVIGLRRRDGARERCLRTLAGNLIDLGVREIFLGRVDHGTAKLDMQAMDTLMLERCGEFEWRHEDPEHEPLLWVSDFVAFAHNAAGDLRHTSQALVATLLTLDV